MHGFKHYLYENKLRLNETNHFLELLLNCTMLSWSDAARPINHAKSPSVPVRTALAQVWWLLPRRGGTAWHPIMTGIRSAEMTVTISHFYVSPLKPLVGVEDTDNNGNTSCAS